jgi:hypothetical protein
LDPVPDGFSLAKPTPLTDITVNDQQLIFTTGALPGLRICTERSSNLIDWEPLSTNLATSATTVIKLNIDFWESKYFFRTHIIP